MTSLVNTIRCPRCRKDLPAGTAFCRRCGAMLPGHVSQPPLQTDHRYIPSDHEGHGGSGRPSPGTRSLLLGAAVLVLGLAVALALWAGRSRLSYASADRRSSIPVSPMVAPPQPMLAGVPPLPPLPPLPGWHRHLPADLPAEPAVGPDYRGQILPQGQFASLPLSDVVFAGADLPQADFVRADLDGADFRGADVSQADFEGADLAGAKFDEAQVRQTRLVGADSAAVAGQTRIRDGIVEPVAAPRLAARHVGQASFRGARVTQVSFEGLDMTGADFSGAELSSVSFRHADLSRANLRDSRHPLTDFEGAKLDGTDLRGADLAWAQNLTPAQLATARTDAATRLPRW